MKEYKHQEPYFVIKRKYLTLEQDEQVQKLLAQLSQEGVKLIENPVVIEPDCPIYDEICDALTHLDKIKVSFRKR